MEEERKKERKRTERVNEEKEGDGGGCERAPEPAVGWDALRRASGDNLTGRGVSMSGLEHSAPICLDERSCCSLAHSWSYEASEEEGMTVAVKVCAECC